MTLHRFPALCLTGVALLVAGCGEVTMRRPSPESAPVLQGPAVSGNGTPMDTAFACFRTRMQERRPGPLAVGVGEVRDFTGKSSINEGATITQGGALMVMSALGKLGNGVRLHERFDPRVGELELLYSDRRQLGDGRIYTIPDGPRQRQVPWLPYMGGSILQSQYFIVGGITEVNWSVQSGGAGVRINNAGIGARTFTMNIAADLRIVDTRSLVVAHTVSLQKQVVGHEVNADIFRFFGARLFDISAGTRNLEPVQMAVRAVLELGVLELLSSVTGITLEGCLDDAVAAGMVSRGYVPPAVPPAPEPPPVAASPPPPPPPPARPHPRPRRTEASAPRPRPAPPCDPSACPPTAVQAPVPLEPIAAPPPASAPAETARFRRPDSETRPPIPSWLEGPAVPAPAPSSLMRPNGAPPVAPVTPMPAPSSVPVQAPHLQDGNSPAPGGRVNILG
ncbi:MAG TPA: CsgG/HfaB family protein [Roseococcus sp.]|jgi:curli biogenesis system outer membrane secretion channel CsgG|nr:CsgG/HfaB family protein [Roseococcus sp.]